MLEFGKKKTMEKHREIDFVPNVGKFEVIKTPKLSIFLRKKWTVFDKLFQKMLKYSQHVFRNEINFSRLFRCVSA